jgi:hypothetical protein
LAQVVEQQGRRIAALEKLVDRIDGRLARLEPPQ